VEGAEQLREILSSLQLTLKEKKLKYVEIRPLSSDLSAEPCVQKSESFCFHVLDLHPALETLFRGFHKGSTQRMIRRAERAALGHEEGSSEELLKKFYHLLVLTRRRHNLPPPPIEWFRNLMTFLGDRLTIRVAYCGRRPVASILTLRHLDTLVYKYGCSDARYHHLGCMPFLLWKAIRAEKERGSQVFDFGRSDTSNEGLIRFKDHFGTTRSILTYSRICSTPAPTVAAVHSMQFAKRIFAHMPDGLLTASGRLLYRHIA
jgi:lipid II:glycine glycyltransferase (peptidoglycan interpeptide bridge formation enzyme)